MSDERYAFGAKPCCPHCGAEMDDPVEDYTIPGQEGFESQAEEQCGECNGWFLVENNGDETCTVSEIDDENEDGE